MILINLKSKKRFKATKVTRRVTQHQELQRYFSSPQTYQARVLQSRSVFIPSAYQLAYLNREICRKAKLPFRTRHGFSNKMTHDFALSSKKGGPVSWIAGYVYDLYLEKPFLYGHESTCLHLLEFLMRRNGYRIRYAGSQLEKIEQSELRILLMRAKSMGRFWFVRQIVARCRRISELQPERVTVPSMEALLPVEMEPLKDVRDWVRRAGEQWIRVPLMARAVLGTLVVASVYFVGVRVDNDLVTSGDIAELVPFSVPHDLYRAELRSYFGLRNHLVFRYRTGETFLKMTTDYSGRMLGAVTAWYPDGKKMWEYATNKEGEVHGEKTLWEPNGNKVIEVYDRGDLIKRTVHEGNQKYEVKY